MRLCLRQYLEGLCDANRAMQISPMPLHVCVRAHTVVFYLERFKAIKRQQISY